MKRIAMSLMTIAAVVTLSVGATGAYFSDTETSVGNTFAAGTLDLNVDGGNTNVVKFNVSNMAPDAQPTGSWTLANVGSIGGYLDLENILVSNAENGCNEPETSAGDVTCATPGAGLGELQNVVNLRLYNDVDKDGYWSTGDVMIYDGLTGGIASSYNQNIYIPAGGSVRINAVFDWWATPSDNLAQGDSMTLDMTFELAQKAVM